jgi:hypothetical protein
MLNIADILGDGDFLSRYIRYHPSCHMATATLHATAPKTQYWEVPSDEDTMTLI